MTDKKSARTVLDLHPLAQATFGSVVEWALKEYPNLSWKQAYLGILTAWNLSCHHPIFKPYGEGIECQICHTAVCRRSRRK